MRIESPVFVKSDRRVLDFTRVQEASSDAIPAKSRTNHWLQSTVYEHFVPPLLSLVPSSFGTAPVAVQAIPS